MSTVPFGYTAVSGSPAACAVFTSFSYVMATSPLPDSKFWIESRALLSYEITLCVTACISVVAAASSPFAMPVTSPRSAAPQSATRFHRAPPLCAGSGVSTPVPDVGRSLQSLMPLGLPGRTSKTATDAEPMPPSGVIRPASWIVWMSGAKDSATTSEPSPLTTFCAWVVEPAYDSLNSTVWPVLSFHSFTNVGMIFAS